MASFAQLSQGLIVFVAGISMRFQHDSVSGPVGSKNRRSRLASCKSTSRDTCARHSIGVPRTTHGHMAGRAAASLRHIGCGLRVWVGGWGGRWDGAARVLGDCFVDLE